MRRDRFHPGYVTSHKSFQCADQLSQRRPQNCTAFVTFRQTYALIHSQVHRRVPRTLDKDTGARPALFGHSLTYIFHA